MSDTFNTPDGDEVFQEDEPPASVDVNVANVVRVDEMPTTSGGLTRRRVGNIGQRILNRDPRRKSATIIAANYDILLDHMAVDTSNSAAFLWPVSVPFVYTDTDELWAACSSSGNQTDISVYDSHWSR